MELTKEKMAEGLGRFIGRIQALPEVCTIQARGTWIYKTDTVKEIRVKVAEIVEKSYHDRYSDVDLHVRARLSPHDTVDAKDYMAMISRYGIDHTTCLGIAFSPENHTYRIVTKEGLRYDMGLEILPDEDAPLLKDAQDFYRRIPGEGWRAADRFWFVQIQALGKLYRRDFLIGDHLANMNLNETLVLQMGMRDRQYGTTHHPYGHSEKLAYLPYLEDLRAHPGRCPYHNDHPVFNYIADKLFAAGVVYDRLAERQIEGYEKRGEIFWEIWAAYAS